MDVDEFVLARAGRDSLHLCQVFCIIIMMMLKICTAMAKTVSGYQELEQRLGFFFSLDASFIGLKLVRPNSEVNPINWAETRCPMG
jgi:hypothetical protein